ncbi:MAG: mRNA surveillance protein pelota [Candidatus Korarchaeota archaeon]
MNVLSFEKNIMEVVPESLNDLWVLYNVIKRGDTVSGKTVRRVGKEDGKGGERLPMYLKVKVEKTEFYEFANRLRVLGRIIEGPEDKVKLNAYHTLNVEIGREIAIEKEYWDEYMLRFIEKAKKETATPLLGVVAVDREEATVALVSLRKVQELAYIRSGLPGKIFAEKGDVGRYFSKILEVLKESLAPETAVVVGGPGDMKKELADFLRDHGYLHVEIEDASSATISGVYEILRRGAHSKVIAEIRAAKELALVDEVFIRIAKSQKNVTYSIPSVRYSAEVGAVETLLVTDVLFREHYDEICDILKNVENTNGTIEIISSEHEGGERLSAIGGIAALLRYNIF